MKVWAGGSTGWNKISGRNINSLRYAHDTTLLQKVKNNKVPLDEGETGELKVGLKLKFRKLRSWHLVPSLHGQ